MEATAAEGPVGILLMNKGLERLPGRCGCHTDESLVALASKGVPPHSMLRLHVAVGGLDEEPFLVTMRDCMTVLHLKQIIENRTGLDARGQALYSGDGLVPLVGNKQLREYDLDQEDVVLVERGLLGGSFCICFVPCPPPCCSVFFHFFAPCRLYKPTKNSTYQHPHTKDNSRC